MSIKTKIRRNLTIAAVCATTMVLQVSTMITPAKAAAGQRVDLRVLVVTANDPGTQAIIQELQTEGVPYTTVAATAGTINAAFLSDTVNGVPRGKFQAVVLPNENPFSDANQLTALRAYEQTFGIRQVDASTWANPNVGLNYAQNPGYIGSLDGITATANPAAGGGAFNYLAGPVPFDAGSYGYLATPASAAFTPIVTAPIPNSSPAAQGSLVGVYTTPDAREELVITTNYNFYQNQFRLIAHGIITWMTRGVHLGYNRNYFSVHSDDVFMPDSRWSVSGNCTPGDDCAAGVPATTDIRMTPADVTALISWQNTNNFKIAQVYNGAGSDEAFDNNGDDPLSNSLFTNRSNFYWINHTYQHEFLGCVQNLTVRPWVCAKTSTGATQWVSGAAIFDQIADNKSFATDNAITISGNELVTGEHSGLKVLPQQTVDNPNLAAQLNSNGITVLASDDSREHDQRTVGNAKTLPRHPMNIFYNVAKQSEEIDEYNWIYTSKANGGSGICENNPSSTCITPLGSTGYTSYIVPLEVTIAMQHVLANDPRPHYVHQSNFAEDRIAYPALTGILNKYKSMFAANAPIVNPTMTAASAQLSNMTVYNADLAANRITAYTLNGQVFLSTTAASSTIPVTAPAGTTINPTGAFGSAYAGELSGWVTVTSGGLTLNTPTTVGGTTTTTGATTTTTGPTTTTRASTTTTRATTTTTRATTTTTRATTTTTRATTTTTRRCRFFFCR